MPFLSRKRYKCRGFNNWETEKHIYPRKMERTEPTKQIKADAWTFVTNYSQSLIIDYLCRSKFASGLYYVITLKFTTGNICKVEKEDRKEHLR